MEKERLALRKECQRLDELSDSKRLMTNAANHLFSYIENQISSHLEIKSILVVVGPGNNGGDALYTAKLLIDSGYDNVDVIVLGGKNKHLDDINLSVTTFNDSDEIKDKFVKASLIVDGLFGVGLNKDVEGLFAKAISCMNHSLAPVLSVDIPSGLDCDTGVVLGEAVQAQWTVTFGLGKPGFYMVDGPDLVGGVVVVDIGYTDVDTVASSAFLFTQAVAHSLFPKRASNSNKATNGKACIIAGKEGMWGAGVLASRGAFRVGSGYVYLNSFEDPKGFLAETPDIIASKIENINEICVDYKAYAIGPGLGVDERVGKLIDFFKSKKVSNVVIDADALSVLAIYSIRDLPDDWILTPHSGEMARLIGCSALDVESDRILALKKCSSMYGCNVLLKGFRTLVGNSERVDIINSGNSALATAGTGDVLSGMITGFLAQGLNILDASGLAAFVHGSCADLWIKRGFSKNSMMASDVLNLIPNVLTGIEN